MPNFKEILSFKKKLSNFDINRHLQNFKNKKDTQEVVLKMNLDQLWNGKQVSGEPIRPSYLEDPYFKTREKAQKYMDWKWRITGDKTTRAKETPNLFIIGTFHKSLYTNVTEKEIEIKSNWNTGNRIIDKFKNILGLTQENKDMISARFMAYILPELQKLKQ